MFEFIKAHQLNIMLALSAACVSFAILLFFTQFLERRKKAALILMEFVATFLLFFDREAYIYSGDLSRTGYIMVRVSNFFVFFLTAMVVLIFNLYLMELFDIDPKTKRTPKRLVFVSVAAILEMIMVIITQFTGLYYYIDENNRYVRGKGFLLCYVVPILCPLIQYTVIRQYKKKVSSLIYTSLVLYIFVPIAMGIIQIFAYGISIVNMAMVLVSISLYIFTYLDINAAVMRAHDIEMQGVREEQKSMQRLFDQTAKAFVKAVEKKDVYSEGHSERVAELAVKIARLCEKDNDECNRIYYSALLHDVGKIGIPDSIIGKNGALTDAEYEIVKNKPLIGSEILSSITEYPYLEQAAHYSSERYDGSGYPEGLKGEQIPEAARIVAVADAYDVMTTKRPFMAPLPLSLAKEEIIKSSGSMFDPKFAKVIASLIDDEMRRLDPEDDREVEREFKCKAYREFVTMGIQVSERVLTITFDFEPTGKSKDFCEPAMVLFDSYDRLIHINDRSIKAFHYSEYGEIWFDGHSVTTEARKIEMKVLPEDEDNVKPVKDPATGKTTYRIVAARYGDHMKIRTEGPTHIVESTVALPSVAKSAYIGLTGENCHVSNITIEKSERHITENDIKRIANEISYIDRLESDLPNVQINRPRSAYTKSVILKDRLIMDFHSMSLPSANLVWHCPYVVLFASSDNTVSGEGYHEFAVIRLNGENDLSGDNEHAENRFSMKKTERFTNWEDWKELNKQGMECSIEIVKRGSRIVFTSETLGISIENTTILKNPSETVCVALTGDQVALTDIRVIM
ncbi:MAG: HD domain-containing protein [Lachnospiraceae bacterium]|nr:HD domain-containing protein [Lachnospiraceae bacterium]